LKNIIGDDLTQDQLLKIWSTPKGQENIRRLLSSIQNPFNPQICEINAYNYYADQITFLLDDLQAPQVQVVSDQEPPLSTAMMNDFYEFYNSVSCFFNQWWPS
ncbi:MAG TPA: hypothetical protein VNJ29_02370, partial [Candidatus Nitrosotenuis sp.]|nr:hypothetical protein [Candidatus Nitrosotenuis sp.]